MMIQFFKELFDYNHTCNQKLNSIYIENIDNLSEKSIELYNHILNAHQIWNHRVKPCQSVFSVWEVHPIIELENIDEQNHKDSLIILDEFDLNKTISYQNSKGQSFQKSIRDILFHIINHSTYHRGQIAKEFRSCGIEPLKTDYIFYKR